MTIPGERAARPRIVHLYLAIIVVSWAANWPLMKLALADAAPLVFVLLRLVGTLALIAPALLLLRAPLLPVAGERLGLFLVGQLQIAGFLICSIIGLAIVPAGPSCSPIRCRSGPSPLSCGLAWRGCAACSWPAPRSALPGSSYS